jgi:ribosomal protein S18 acetylase RimI-like enzyme
MMDTTYLNIRPYTEQDRNHVIDLWILCGLVVPQNDPGADIDRKLHVNPELFLVACLDGDIVGTVMAGYEGHRGWINYLAAHPAQRRLGIGRALMTAAEERLRDLGCPKINLQVRTGNKEALAFYRTIGFVQDDVVSLGKRLLQDS